MAAFLRNLRELPGTSLAPAVGYGAALAIVLVGFLARLALQPLFGASHAFTAFYPGVILAAYFLGARPAIITATFSALLAYWIFAPPVLALKADVEVLTTLLFEMGRRDAKKGLATLCIGGGMGIAMCVER